MTREQIKNHMIARIQDTLQSEMEENLIDYVDLDTINDFLWNKDFGLEIARNYIEEHVDTMVEELLEEIYDEIDTDDISSPW